MKKSTHIDQTLALCHVFEFGRVTVTIRKKLVRKVRVRRERPENLGYISPNVRVL